MTVETGSRVPQVERVDFRKFDPAALGAVFSDEWYYWQNHEYNFRHSGAGDRWSFSFVRVPQDTVMAVSLYRQSGLTMRLHDVEAVEIDKQYGAVKFLSRPLMPFDRRRKSYIIASGGFYHELKDERGRTVSIRTVRDFKPYSG